MRKIQNIMRNDGSGVPVPDGGRVARNPFADMFRLKRPCANCPFRKTGAIELRPGRLQGIVNDLLVDDWSSFSCHKTVYPVDDADSSSNQPEARESMCAGAAIYLQKVGRPSVGMRLAQSMGILDAKGLEAQSSTVIEPLAESRPTLARSTITR